MQNRPTAAELLDTVRELLTTEILPTVQEDGLRFKVLIAANVLAIVGRELTSGDPLLREELDRLLHLLPESPEAVDTTTPIAEKIGALNTQLAALIRTTPAESTSIEPGGDVWTHVKQTLREQLTVANPKFTL
jgi:hypothetical protein